MPAKLGRLLGEPAARKRSTMPRWSSSSMVRGCSPAARDPSSPTAYALASGSLLLGGQRQPKMVDYRDAS
jgi:hypothetical protein